MLAVELSGLVAAGVIVVATIGLTLIQARRRTLNRGPRRDQGREEPPPDDS